MPEHTEEQEPKQGPDEGGQVSEVSGMPAESEIDPISPEDATAGAPDDTPDDPQEGTAGPDAPPRHGRPEQSNESSR